MRSAPGIPADTAECPTYGMNEKIVLSLKNHMNRARHRGWIKNGLSMLCIAVFLFSYVNATMFWHGHVVYGHKIFHSHISSAAHRSAPEDNPHTQKGLQLIQIVDMFSCTDKVIPSYNLEPDFRIIETICTEPVQLTVIRSYDYISHRGPPELV